MSSGSLRKSKTYSLYKFKNKGTECVTWDPHVASVVPSLALMYRTAINAMQFGSKSIMEARARNQEEEKCTIVDVDNTPIDADDFRCEYTVDSVPRIPKSMKPGRFSWSATIVRERRFGRAVRYWFYMGNDVRACPSFVAGQHGAMIGCNMIISANKSDLSLPSSLRSEGYAGKVRRVACEKEPFYYGVFNKDRKQMMSVSRSHSGMKISLDVPRNNRKIHLATRVSCYDPLSSCVVEYGGRVKKASTKNFQIVHEGLAVDKTGRKHPNVLLQMGRATSHTFAVEFSYPFFPFEAFALCLVNFEKL